MLRMKGAVGVRMKCRMTIAEWMSSCGYRGMDGGEFDENHAWFEISTEICILRALRS